MISALEVKKLMNSAGKSGTPFLFGLDYELREGFFIEHPLDQSDVLWRVGSNSNFTQQSTNKEPLITPQHIGLEQYKAMFDNLYAGLYRGDSFLANLTAKTPIECNYSLEEILLASQSPYALLLPERFVCFSPEIFVRIQGGEISSYPMKGTISASVEGAEQKILDDYKESAEHFTIVDLIRSDLSRVATNVRVENLRYIDRLALSSGDILQVSSKIAGDLATDYATRIGDVIYSLLPAGSISGAPKPATLKLIEESEPTHRGFYCGVFGYFDGQSLDSAVLIRFVEKCGEQLYFRSGSGITINSDVEYEYDEVNQKIYLPF